MISLSLAKILLKLSQNESLNFSAVTGTSNHEHLKKMLDDGAVEYSTKGTRHKKLYCTDPTKISNYLHNHFRIPSLVEYITVKEKEEVERGELARASGDSKLENFRIFEGFLINTYEESFGELQGSKIPLQPINGCYTFIHDYKHFAIPSELTLVVVEGYENFKFVARQRHLFNDIKPLFIWRYQNSNVIAEWLNLIENDYVHFGDFDPKGLHIYVSEFRNKITSKSGRFFIPENLEDLFKLHGNRKRYEEQMDRIRNFNFENYPEISEVWRLIKQYRQGVDQEVLIPVRTV